MKTPFLIFIALCNTAFGQTLQMTEKQIDDHVLKLIHLKNSGKLIKVSNFNMSACAGSINGYYLDNKLVMIESRYNAELGYSERNCYFLNDTIVKLIYRSYRAEWEKYEKKYPPDKIEFDALKMTYTDTFYHFYLGSEKTCYKRAKNFSIKSGFGLWDKQGFTSCVKSMSEQLLRTFAFTDSLKLITDMPYLSENDDCGDERFWNVVKLNDCVIELLIDKLDDSTITEATVPNFGGNYTVADIAYSALQEIIHGIPTFKLLGVPFDTSGCGYCAYWNHLGTYSNRILFKEAVKNWYFLNRDKLVWVTNQSYSTCDCMVKHPAGGHYEVKINKK